MPAISRPRAVLGLHRPISMDPHHHQIFKTSLVVFLLLSWLDPPGAAASSGGSHVLRANIRVDRDAPAETDPLTALRDADLELIRMVGRQVPDWSPEAEAVRSRVRALLGRLLDYEQIARNALGSDWEKLTPAQEAEFLVLFSRLTNRAFVTALTAPEVHQRFDSETMFGPTASVSVTAWGPGSASPERRLEYRLARKQNRWLVYDVILDGVSLAEGYRDQFNRLMRRGGVTEILDCMHRKLEETADAL